MMADSVDNGLVSALQEQLAVAQQKLTKTATYTQALESAMKQQLASQIERNGLLQQELTALKAAAVKRQDLPRIGSPLRAGGSPLALGSPHVLPDRLTGDSHRRGGGSVDSPLSQVLKTRNDNGNSRTTRTVPAGKVANLEAEVQQLRQQLAAQSTETDKLKHDLLEYQSMVERQDDVLQAYSTRVTRLQSKADSGMDLTPALLASKRPSAIGVGLLGDRTKSGDEPPLTRPIALFQVQASMLECDLCTAAAEDVNIVLTLTPRQHVDLPKTWPTTRKTDPTQTRRVTLSVAQLEACRTALLTQYPHCVTPPLLVRREDGKLLQASALVVFACERFVSHLLQHPLLSCSSIVVKLITGKAATKGPERFSTLEANRDVQLFDDHPMSLEQLETLEATLTRCQQGLNELHRQQQQASLQHHQVSAAFMLLQQQPWLGSSHEAGLTLSHIHSSMAAVSREQQEDLSLLAHWFASLTQHLATARQTPTNHAELELVVSQLNVDLNQLLRTHAIRLAESQGQLQSCATLATTVV
eukprot:m.33254 g.33254  ORF g.33254 m.33254 type:complete len:529 (+) comp12215_c0_seq1:292-1878(+)